ncbi:ABC transporter substrate-binding protein [Niveispirillum fermenti]|uniref:ABC transporter substrate-binding protein n=1 Tax=Niveispirillum fermenti TaxID=1233113 RepID=UPI003A846F63
MDRRGFITGTGGLLLLAGCGGDRAAVARRTLVIGKAGDLSGMDPAVTVQANDFAPIGLAYERLLRFRMQDGQPTGGLDGELAADWQGEDGGRSWLFALSPGHAFDDGTQVTAEAVRFSFDRALRIGRGVAQALDGLDRVEALNDMRVRFTLRGPNPVFPYILALLPMAVINPAVMAHERGGDLARGYLSERTAGSGPYRVKSWTRGQRVVLTANPYSLRPPRHFDRVVIKVVKDEAAWRTQLRKGDLDIFDNVAPDAAAPVSRLDGVTLLSRPTPAVIALIPNNERAPLDRPAVRRALALAVDAPRIADTIMAGRASPIHGLLPDGVPGQDSSIPVIMRDVAAARALLDAEGVGPGLRLTLSYVQASAASDAVALALQSQLAEAGIDLRLEVLAPSAMAKVVKGDFDLTIFSWYADFPDPWPILKFALHSANKGEGLNLARYANPAVDALLEQAEATMEQAPRVALYGQAQRLAIMDQPFVPLFAPHGLMAHRRDLSGLEYSFWQPGLYNAARMGRLRGGAA